MGIQTDRIGHQRARFDCWPTITIRGPLPIAKYRGDQPALHIDLAHAVIRVVTDIEVAIVLVKS